MGEAMSERDTLTATQWGRLIELMRHQPPRPDETVDEFQQRCSAAIGLRSRLVQMNLVDEACDAARCATWSMQAVMVRRAAQVPVSENVSAEAAPPSTAAGDEISTA